MRPIRSILFSPGDSEKKLGKALSTNTDAVILDLEDSVAPANKKTARGMVSEFLNSPERDKTDKSIWVRINALDTDDCLQDLAAVVAPKLNGIMLPKPDGPADLIRLAYYLDAFETRAGMPTGTISILPVVSETAKAALNLHAYGDLKLDRLLGLTWGAEDLSTALGASGNRDDDGEWALTYRIVRSFTLMAAKACGVQAIETLYADFRDDDGLKKSSIAARREGFTGRMVIHPAQIDIVNDAFSPDPDEVAFAERVVAAFEAQPNAGTVGLDGKMLDIPHLNQAMYILKMRDLFLK